MKRYSRPRGWIRFEDLPNSPKAHAVCADILDRYRQHHDEDTLPRGGNGIFYDLRPSGMPRNPRDVTYIKKKKGEKYGPMEAGGGYVQNLLALMRRVWNPETEEWLIDEEWISDSRAPEPSLPNDTDDPEWEATLITNGIKRLWLKRQAGQKVYLEIRCEAADLMPRIERVALPYGVPVYSGGGADGLKPKKEAASRAAWRKVPTKIAHLTDWNEHGRDIADAFKEDVVAFCDWHREHEDAPGSLSVVHLGLTLAQAKAHKLLDADGNAELDGLPVPALDKIVKNFIKSNHKTTIRRKVIDAEPKMRLEVARHVLRMLREPE
jgi:hypothetical protein